MLQVNKVGYTITISVYKLFVNIPTFYSSMNHFNSSKFCFAIGRLLSLSSRLLEACNICLMAAFNSNDWLSERAKSYLYLFDLFQGLTYIKLDKMRSYAQALIFSTSSEAQSLTSGPAGILHVM